MRGQAMSVFKIMIGSVFALALLGIISSFLSGVSCPYSTFDEVKNLALQASRDPGKCFHRETVCINKGTSLTKVGLETNLPGISLTVNSTVDKIIVCSSDGCEIKAKLKIPVRAFCSTPIDCIITLDQLC